MDSLEVMKELLQIMEEINAYYEHSVNGAAAFTLACTWRAEQNEAN